MIKSEVQEGVRYTYASKTADANDTEPHYLIRQTETGLLFESAYDSLSSNFTYQETSLPVDRHNTLHVE